MSSACPACGHRVRLAAGYCGRCGAALLLAGKVGAGPVTTTPAANGCPRCGAARLGTERYCPSCGVDCWALAAGSGPTWSSVTTAPAQARSTDASPSRRTALAGRRLRLGVGFACAALLAVNALAGMAGDARDGSPGGPPGTVDVGPSGRVLGVVAVPTEAPTEAPAGVATPGAAGASTAPSAVTAVGPVSSVVPTPVATLDPFSTGAPPPAPTPAPVPTAASPPATIVLEGTGSELTEPFAYPGGTVRVHSRATAASGGCVYIGSFGSTDAGNLPADPSLRTAVIFLEGAGSDEGWVDLDLPAGSYFMDIESDCAWTVTIARS